MRIARWSGPDADAEGFVIDESVVPFPAGVTVDTLLRGGLDRAAQVYSEVAGSAGLPLSAVSLRSPLQPASIRDFSAYEEHVEGMSADETGVSHVPPAWYEAPTFYFSHPHVVIPDGASVRPPVTERLDYELEVAAVVGAAPGSDGRNLTVDQSAAHVFGYVIMNDWSARDVQAREMRVYLGPAKGKDFATTLGPWIVTADELTPYVDGDGFLALRAEVYVNDVLVGEDLISNMAWTFPELAAYASRSSVIVPGDVLGAGTAGNGGCLGELWGRNGSRSAPPLAEGDVVRMTVEGIGEISNRVGHAQVEHPLPTARTRPLPRRRHAR